MFVGLQPWCPAREAPRAISPSFLFSALIPFLCLLMAAASAAYCTASFLILIGRFVTLEP